jgi:hypothetical protein
METTRTGLERGRGIARVRGGSDRGEAGRPARSRAGGAGRGDERIAAWQAVLSEPGRDEAVQIGAVRNAVGRTKRGVNGRGVRCVAGQTWRYGTVRSGVGRCRASVTGLIGVLRCSAARCGEALVDLRQRGASLPWRFVLRWTTNVSNRSIFFECESTEGGEFSWEFIGNSMGIQCQKREFRVKQACEVMVFLTCATIGSAPELAFYNIN